MQFFKFDKKFKSLRGLINIFANLQKIPVSTKSSLNAINAIYLQGGHNISVDVIRLNATHRNKAEI